MLFYRVARPSEDGDEQIPFGPYCFNRVGEVGEEILDQMNIEHSDEDHPTPQFDGLYDVRIGEYCGFVSMTYLSDWFGTWLPKLGEIGFKIYVYEVPDEKVRIGIRQAVSVLRPEWLVEVIELSNTEVMAA